MATEQEDDFDLAYSGGLEEYQEEEEKEYKNLTPGLLAASRPSYSGRRYYIMYHGTTWANAMKIKAGNFIPSPDGLLGRGVYLSRNFQKASLFPLFNRTARLAVLKLNVRVGKVKRIDYHGHPMQKTWHQHGFDSAWVPPNCGMVQPGFELDCVYDPCRIEVLQVIPN